MDVLLVGVCKRVEVVVVVLIYLFRLAVELEDTNIRVVIVAVEHVKCVDMDANALASVPEDASVLHALAAQVKDSAALNDAVVANARV